jgi:hypothetical protein
LVGCIAREFPVPSNLVGWAGVLGDLPSWVDLDFALTATALLAIVAVALVLIVLFMVRSVVTRLLVAIAVGAAAFGLLHYRNELQHCDESGCACVLFGEEIAGGGCAVPQR